MAAFFVGLSAASIITGATTSFLVGCLTSTTYSVYNYINRIRSYNHPYTVEIQKELDKIDLQFSIDIINEIFKQYTNMSDEAGPALKHAIYGVTEIMEIIETELQTVDESIKLHNNKYFSRWRTFNCTCNLDVIKRNKQILDSRYKTFISLLKLDKLMPRTNQLYPSLQSIDAK
jgi:hypothetical protein